MGDGHDENGIRPNETGRPIAELRELVVEVRPGFVGRVRRRIDRRVLTGQLLSLSWHVPAAIALEFLGMIFEMVGIGDSPKGGSR
jgi:hypothetical protein